MVRRPTEATILRPTSVRFKCGSDLYGCIYGSRLPRTVVSPAWHSRLYAATAAVVPPSNDMGVKLQNLANAMQMLRAIAGESKSDVSGVAAGNAS